MQAMLRVLSRSLAPLFLAVIPFGAAACSGGGGGASTPALKASDLNGTWTITETVTAANGTACDAIGTSETFDITIAASDTSTVVTITPAGEAPFTLTRSGSRVRGTLVDAGTFFRDTTNFDLGISNGALTGTVTLEELALIGGSQSTLCNSSRRITGVRNTSGGGGGGGGGGGSSTFNGTWSVTTTLVTSTPDGCTDSSDTFTTTIVVNGTTATLTDAGGNPFTLTLQNGRLQGQVQEEVALGITLTALFDIGQPSTNTLSGTLTNTLSGSFLCVEVLTLTASRL